MFVLFVGVHKLNYLWSVAFGFNIQKTLGFTLLVFPILFLILAVHKAVTSNFCSLGVKSFHVKFIICYVLFLLLVGVLRGNYTAKIIDELWTSVIIFLSYKLGAIDFIWELFRRKIIWIYIIFSGFVMLGTQFLQEQLVNGDSSIERFEGVTVATEAYNISPILDFWPVLFLMGLYQKETNVWKNLVSYVPFIIYLLFQLFFLKRAPTARAITYFVVGILFLAYIRRSGLGSLGLIFTLMMGVFLFYQYLPENLVERFKSEDSSRQNELLRMLNDLNVLEALFGKGLGGEYATESNGVFERLNSSGVRVKSTLHIGIGDPLLKGGFILFIAIFTHLILVLKFGLINIRKIGDIGFTAFIFLLVFALYRLIEGGLTPGAIFNAFCFGISLGALDKLRLMKM